MRIHLVGVSGSGMGQLAMLLREAGHEVQGSDTSFDAPMGPALEAAGVRCLVGWNPALLDVGGAPPDLVVVGNVARRDNPEAAAAEARGLARVAMSEALRTHFLTGRRPLVVAGTHGKTTTSSLAAHLLRGAGLKPGWFVGGFPHDLPSGAGVGARARKILATGGKASAPPAPFVVEGDEYDAVYWKKEPKLFDYVGVAPGEVLVLTSLEHDHIDIYPTAAAYEAAFAEAVRRVPETGLVVAYAGDAAVRRVVRDHARARTSFYALEGDDTGEVTPTWHAGLARAEGELQPFDLYGQGSFFGRLALRVPGAHNVKNAIAAFAAVTEGLDADVALVKQALGTFRGVRRRQDLLGEPGGVRVYDDFAHHPTAVDETLRALRRKHPGGRLVAAFEPRSATACRALHQDAYARAFDAADRVVLAPLGRSTIPEAERLDLVRLARSLGSKAIVAVDLDEVVARLVDEPAPGDTVALLSNGAFGGVPGRVLGGLAARTR